MENNNTPQEQMVYVPVSVAEDPPPTQTPVVCLQDRDLYITMKCYVPKGNDGNRTPYWRDADRNNITEPEYVTHWLQPVPLSSLLPQPAPQGEEELPLTQCMMGRDAECNHPKCPVTDEDANNGRYCTLPLYDYRNEQESDWEQDFQDTFFFDTCFTNMAAVEKVKAFMRKHLTPTPQGEDLEALQKENEALKKRIKELENKQS